MSNVCSFFAALFVGISSIYWGMGLARLQVPECHDAQTWYCLQPFFWLICGGLLIIVAVASIIQSAFGQLRSRRK